MKLSKRTWKYTNSEKKVARIIHEINSQIGHLRRRIINLEKMKEEGLKKLKEKKHISNEKVDKKRKINISNL